MLALVTAAPTTRLAASAVTRSVSAPPNLIEALPTAAGAMCFVHRGVGFVGWGEHARFSASGADAAARIEEWFAQVTAGLTVDNPVGGPGTGPLAFVSLGFDDNDVAVAVIPQSVLALRGADRRGFLTTIGEGTRGARDPRIARTPFRAPGRVSYADAELSVAGFIGAVTAAKARIGAGELAKVVLAHDLVATADAPVDERFLLRHLAQRYRDCWTFALEGLVGASPELLIRRQGRAITSRVLAGTAWPEHRHERVAADLLASEKDLAEHDFAVRSVADVLRPLCRDLQVPDRPAPLELANLTHLSTVVTGRLGHGAPSALQLAARMHPTAAVGGSPTPAAMAAIRQLEPTSRGRYAAPVGWIDGSGDGEFALALRCAQVNGRTVRLLAGCGIVADSDPQSEAREAQIKMIPIRDALEAQHRPAVRSVERKQAQ